MLRPIRLGPPLSQLNFILGRRASIDCEIAIIHSICFSAAEHNCAKTKEKNRLRRVSVGSTMMKASHCNSLPCRDLFRNDPKE